MEDAPFAYKPQPPASPYPPPRRGGWPLLTFALAVLALVLMYRLWFAEPRATYDPNAEPRTVTPRGDLAADEQATIALFREASKSVVNIETSTVSRERFSLNAMEIPQGTGSGIVWDDEGHIVTNYHVLESGSQVKVTLADGSTWPAAVVGDARDNDIAVVRVNAPANRLRKIPVGDSGDLMVGQKAFAIGNPFGLDQTLTTGVVSGLGREIYSKTGRKIEGVIQTDAAVNPGNSGGPLLDSYGRLIGVNTAIYSPTGASAGIGFAIPVDTVNRIVPQILQNGRVMRPGFGVVIAPDHIVKQLDRTGVMVYRVPEGSAGAKSGLQGVQESKNGDTRFGDIIVAVDDRRVNGADDLFAALETHKVGDTVSVTVIRDVNTDNEKTLKLSVTLQALNE